MAAAPLPVSTRDEIEWALAGNALDLGLLDDSPYAPLLARRKVRDRLAPVFTTEFKRTARTLAFPDGTLAELALDRGTIRAGNEEVPISECEIELKGDDAARLFALAREIARDIPVRLGHASRQS